ncbi:uncharacterized protein LOC127722861 isoform X3 [Mytilus californianus]|uniref:uncharacterized protein LOC127722861 isoform X3 n=1 Tax=Mytilus californianus TaxID=6549 RepID=UPI0022470A56|nr:uncharacterized protein LOC127722861 isoform X3 [Mytilus californianus]
MKQFSLLSSLLSFIIDLLVVGYSESYRSYRSYYSYRSYRYSYYRYSSYRSYYNYDSYRYNSYANYNSSSNNTDEAIIVGGVLGGLFGMCLFISCIVYCNNKCERTRTSRAVIATSYPTTGVSTIGSPTIYPAAPAYNGATDQPDGDIRFNQPPPPYEAVATNNVYPSNVENVDSTSKVDLVNNEVKPQ